LAAVNSHDLRKRHNSFFSLNCHCAAKTSALSLRSCRGALIDTKALIDALKSGRLGGVGLDVYKEEDGFFSKTCRSDFVG